MKIFTFSDVFNKNEDFLNIKINISIVFTKL